MALLLQHHSGHVHVYADGSSRWSKTAPDPASWWDPSDVPESIACRRLSYGAARLAFAQAMKRLRARRVAISG